MIQIPDQELMKVKVLFNLPLNGKLVRSLEINYKNPLFLGQALMNKRNHKELCIRLELKLKLKIKK